MIEDFGKHALSGRVHQVTKYVRRIYMASFTANFRAIYLAFIDDSTMVDCLLEYQLTSFLLSIKIYPEVDL